MTHDPVRRMYDGIAASYDAMVEREIGQPVYTEALRRLSQAVQALCGPIVDLACGSGQMLARYRADFDPERALVGIDLSPEMVAITAAKLDANADVRVGEMRAPGVAEAAGVLNWFALHHLEAPEAARAIATWYGALAPGGFLSVATWEGQGLVDYGDAADLVAFRHDADAVRGWAAAAGFSVHRCVTQPVEGMPMDAVYLEASRPTG